MTTTTDPWALRESAEVDFTPPPIPAISWPDNPPADVYLAVVAVDQVQSTEYHPDGSPGDPRYFKDGSPIMDHVVHGIIMLGRNVTLSGGVAPKEMDEARLFVSGSMMAPWRESRRALGRAIRLGDLLRVEFTSVDAKSRAKVRAFTWADPVRGKHDKYVAAAAEALGRRERVAPEPPPAAPQAAAAAPVTDPFPPPGPGPSAPPAAPTPPPPPPGGIEEPF